MGRPMIVINKVSNWQLLSDSTLLDCHLESSEKSLVELFEDFRDVYLSYVLATYRDIEVGGTVLSLGQKLIK